jgi:RNA polymerase sigma-70 factor (ECF subfamily)
VSADDHRLIAECLKGDASAFGALVRRHQDRLYHTVFRLVGSAEDAQDVVQEAFLSAYQSLDGFKGDALFFTWLYRIAVNEALRGRKRRTFANADALPEVEAPPPVPPEEDVPTLATLEKLLRKLSDEFRSIVVLRDIEGLAYTEIAETLEIPIGTVESRLFRARQELRALWRQSKEAKNAL